MSEEKKTTVIIVTEARAAGYATERRYAADGWTITEGTLFVNREGIAVAVYPPTMWMSFRSGDAEAPDGIVLALGIAKGALRTIAQTSPNELAKVRQLAKDALVEIFTEIEL